VPRAASPAATVAAAEASPTAEGRAAKEPVIPARVRALAARLTLERRVAQLFVVGFAGTDASRAVERGWGGILLESGNSPAPGTLPVVAGPAAGPKPLVVAGTDLLGMVPQPAAAAPAKARAVAREAATRLSAAGVDLVLAPVADLAVAAGYATEMSFGEDPQAVAAATVAAVAGWRAGGITAAPTHFPGQGAASQDPIDGPAVVSGRPDDLWARDLVPFRAVLPHARAVVVSSAAYAAFDSVTPAALDPAVVGDLLRGRLGYRGVAMSDDLAGVAAGTGGAIGPAAVDALKAGIDLVQIPDPTEAAAAYEIVLRAARSGEIPRRRLDEAVLRILALKDQEARLGD
jgi:beta-N-acetylhexosaminidase